MNRKEHDAYNGGISTVIQIAHAHGDTHIVDYTMGADNADEIFGWHCRQGWSTVVICGLDRWWFDEVLWPWICGDENDLTAMQKEQLEPWYYDEAAHV